eukprot:m.9631 g.9631  ORF g.9631 m.9631 type:complete len:57 (+) comp5447_c0_seq1:104-274(+)
MIILLLFWLFSFTFLAALFSIQNFFSLVLLSSNWQPATPSFSLCSFFLLVVNVEEN